MNLKFLLPEPLRKRFLPVTPTKNIHIVNLTIMTGGIDIHVNGDSDVRREEALTLTNNNGIDPSWEEHLIFPLLCKTVSAWRSYRAMNTAVGAPASCVWHIGDVVSFTKSVRIWIITRVLSDNNPNKPQILELTGYNDHEVVYTDEGTLTRQHRPPGGQVLASVYINKESAWFRFREGRDFRLVTTFHDFESRGVGGWLEGVYEEALRVGHKIAQGEI